MLPGDSKEMNERFEQMMLEATKDMPQGYYVPGEYFQKFAELIIQECIGVVEGGRFLHDQAPTALFAKECSGAIKRHFGVEL